MKTEQILEAMGGISDEYITEAHENIRIKKSRLRPFAIAAAAVLCIAAPLPAGVAAGSDDAYNVLYAIMPSAAQTFKPVQRSCTDNGIRMEVISADISGSEARVLLSLQDIEADRIDGTIDLFDSYRINIPFDNVGHCSFSEYDADTKTAYFVVNIERMDGKDIPNRKITFSVGQLFAHKQHIESYIDGIDLSTVSEAAETFKPEWINGCSDRITPEIAESMDFIVPSDTPLCYAADGMGITGIGFADGKLHIQLFNETKHTTDNHGYLSIVRSDGTKITAEGYASFKNGDSNFNSYEEYIYNVSPEELSDSRLYGEFVTAPPCIEGNWQVTFRLEK